MNAVDRLRRDHRILRAKLTVLETALKMGAEAWYVLREVCFTLARQLRDHIRREDELVATCRRDLNPKVLAEVVIEHEEEPHHLRTINRLFVLDADHSFTQIKAVLEHVIQSLRRHMDEEERELFPLLERFMTEAVRPPASSTTLSRPLDETMTVNRIIQTYPNTKRVFEGLFINVPMEGCTCLDEVAWRHGMEVGELLERLERTIAACPCRTTKTRSANRISRALEVVADSAEPQAISPSED